MMDDDARDIVMARLAASAVDDHDEDLPTAYALARARALLSEASPLPRASVSSGYGAIYIYWRLRERRIHVMVAASLGAQEFLYFQDGDMHGIDKDLSPSLVSAWLRWYLGGPRP